MKVLRVDLGTQTVRVEERGDELLGGRRLTAEIVASEVDPGCDPLSPDNVLVWATGPLAGWRLSCGDRLSLGAKSPLTGGIKESNSGGVVAEALAGLDCRALAVGGAFAAGAPGLLVVDGPDAVRFVPGEAYWGQRLEALAGRLRADFGPEYAMVAIGPAGEMQLPAAAVCTSDVRGDPFRFSARGGLAAVMGSKGLKAVLIRKRRRPRPAGEAFRAAVRAFHQAISNNPRVEVLRKYGTASTVMLTDSLGALPTRNFSQGTFEQAEAISGEALHDLITGRGGEGTPSEPCMSTCIIQCSNIVPDEAGRRLVARLEYETLVMCGANLGIGDLDTIARINQECNGLGLDTIEVGATLGVAAEAGLLDFGDGARALELVGEIGRGTVVGRLLGQGAAVAGRILGVGRVPAVKGQALPAYDPRGVKGTGVTFATNPMGGDHTAGLTIFAPVDHHQAEGQVALSRGVQHTRAAYDALGLCAFLLGSTAARPELVTGMLNAAYGTTLAPGWIAELGREVLDLERAYNHRAGLTAATDRLPAFFSSEPLPPHGEVFDVPPEELDGIWQEEE
ncbi:MAG: aldehyde ferredoxin oxidoreductase C-terminal domain-containing protein [Anaerolineae bacterium]